MGIPDDDEFLSLIAERFQVLGDVSRLAILRAIVDGELPVNEIIKRTALNQPNVSKHLNLMHDAGILARRKEGLHVYYAIADPNLIGLCKLAGESVVKTAEAEIEAIRKTLGSYLKDGRPGRG